MIQLSNKNLTTIAKRLAHPFSQLASLSSVVARTNPSLSLSLPTPLTLTTVKKSSLGLRPRHSMGRSVSKSILDN
jgi:hypothetical protein